jgi:pyruvate dehydrogenase E2 component (dihydrolipoamide acetyltransferase)
MAADTDAEFTETPYSGIRKAVGVNMLGAWTTVPMVTHHVKVDAGTLLDVREAINKGVEDKEERVTINDFLLKLTAAALKLMPAVNSSLDGDRIKVYHRVHLGMATALDGGLIVPVIRDADKKSLIQISGEAKDLAARARNGKLRPDDVAGGTFTISNLGGYGSVDEVTPIVNPPQAAILGVGRVVDTPVVYHGEIQARPMMTLSFTYDHRVIDGAVAARFIKILMDIIGNPFRAICG